LRDDTDDDHEADEPGQYREQFFPFRHGCLMSLLRWAGELRRQVGREHDRAPRKLLTGGYQVDSGSRPAGYCRAIGAARRAGRNDWLQPRSLPVKTALSAAGTM
jgi:hypothetical protein